MHKCGKYDDVKSKYVRKKGARGTKRATVGFDQCYKWLNLMEKIKGCALVMNVMVTSTAASVTEEKVKNPITFMHRYNV